MCDEIYRERVQFYISFFRCQHLMIHYTVKQYRALHRKKEKKLHFHFRQIEIVHPIIRYTRLELTFVSKAERGQQIYRPSLSAKVSGWG